MLSRGTSIATLLLISVYIASVLAWGDDGHMLTAMIATERISSHTQNCINEIIPNGNLTAVVTWADQVKHDPGWGWSQALHFVNTKDNPPFQCSYNFTRDCPPLSYDSEYGYCVVGAVTNYTAQTQNGTNEPDALQFLIHFIGDAHQPLHCTGKDLGGLDVQVTFFGQSVTLHYVWDISIIQKREDELGGIVAYYKELQANISGEWKDEISAWLQCADPNTSNCPGQWATESNTLVCTNAWPYDYTDDPSLDWTYYNQNLPIVSQRLAQAGVRMAAVLDEVFADYCLPNGAGGGLVKCADMS